MVLYQFVIMSNLFSPFTLDASFAHDGTGQVLGIKEELEDADGKTRTRRNTQGHRDRIISVSEHELALFAQLYDEAGTPPLEARLPALHAHQLLGVLEKFAAQPKRLGDFQGEYMSLEMWHETNAQKDGTISGGKRDFQKMPENEYSPGRIPLWAHRFTRPRAPSVRRTAITTCWIWKLCPMITCRAPTTSRTARWMNTERGRRR